MGVKLLINLKNSPVIMSISATSCSASPCRFLKKWHCLNPVRWFKKTHPQVGLIRLHGVISSHSGRFSSKGLSLETLQETIDQAFKIPRLKAIALSINSPGGSPVQSELISEYIRQKAKEQHIPVLSFIEDIAASGGYWLACTGEEIFAMGASLIGSIGVISSGFGFQEAIKKLGVERRIYAEGNNKSLLDPFSPEKPEDIAILKSALKEIHAQFKDHVRSCRKEKLKADEETLFNGAFWVGNQAKELGLIDEIGDLHSTLKAKFGEKVKIIQCNKPKGMIKRLLESFSPASLLVTSMETALSHLEERSFWQRFGL